LTGLIDARRRTGLASPAAQPPVAVRDLAKRFGKTVAVDGVSFDVRPGEVLGLLGPNGAGKTTTLHMLLGVIRPTSGAVRLFGLDPHDGTKAALRRVGFASPEALMDWRLSVAQNLRVYAALYDAPKGAIDQAIDLLHLRDLAASRFGDLSLGQQTRAGLARALLHEPDLLVLDEPLANLDPAGAEVVAPLLGPAPGRTRVIVTHDVEAALEQADRVLGLHRDGSVAFEIAAAEVDPATAREIYSERAGAVR